MLTAHRIVVLGSVIALGLWLLLALQHVARRRVDGSRALIFAIVWIVGLATAVTQVLTPRLRVDDPSMVPSPLAGSVSHYMSLACLLLATAGTAAGLVRRGLRGGAVLAAVWAFALGPLVASQAGTVPYWTKGLVYLPLVTTAIALNADGDIEWIVRQLRHITRVYTYGTILAFLVAKHWATYPPPPNSAARAWFGVSQVAGLTPHPNSLGPIAALAVLLEFSAIARARRWKWHVTAGLVVVALAESRTGLMMTVFGIVLMHRHSGGKAMLRGGVGKAVYASGILASVVGLVTYGQPGSLASKVNVAQAVKLLNGRTGVWQYAWSEFHRNHLCGYGPSLFSVSYRSLLPSQLQFAGEAHNQVLQTLGEAGLVGLMGLLIYTALIFTAGVRSGLRTEGLGLALVASLLIRIASEAPLRDYGVNIALFCHLVVLLVLIYGQPKAGKRGTRASAAPRAEQPVLALAA